MEQLSREFRQELYAQGADLVGFGGLSVLPMEAREGLPIGVSVAVKYPPEVIAGITELPTPLYHEHYELLNVRLDHIVRYGAKWLEERGYRAVAQDRPFVRQFQREDGTRLPQKTVATRAGIGWIGKCALLVTKEYGSAIRLSSLLTDAPLVTNEPVNQSSCGDCGICREACPGGAVLGENWALGMARDRFYDYARCRDTAMERSKMGLGEAMTICGKCIAACPYTKGYLKREGVEMA